MDTLAARSLGIQIISIGNARLLINQRQGLLPLKFQLACNIVEADGNIIIHIDRRIGADGKAGQTIAAQLGQAFDGILCRCTSLTVGDDRNLLTRSRIDCNRVIPCGSAAPSAVRQTIRIGCLIVFILIRHLQRAVHIVRNVLLKCNVQDAVFDICANILTLFNRHCIAIDKDIKGKAFILQRIFGKVNIVVGVVARNCNMVVRLAETSAAGLIIKETQANHCAARAGVHAESQLRTQETEGVYTCHRIV